MSYQEIVDQSEAHNNLKNTADKVLEKLAKVFNYPTQSSRRWVWELLQNAKDEANKFGRVSIELEISENLLAFRHNADPFKHNEILSLIQQVSSKPSNSKNDSQTGKFGTGFITTHILSRKIRVKGVLGDLGEVPRRFEVLIDRTAEDSEGMIPILKNCLESTKKAIKDPDQFQQCENYHFQRTEESLDNEFIYDLTTAEGKAAATVGISELEYTLPLTLAFVEKIKKVTIKDFINNKQTQIESIIVKESENTTHYKINSLDLVDGTELTPRFGTGS
jgi:hypothetical protein